MGVMWIIFYFLMLPIRGNVCRLLLKKPDYYLDELAAKVTKHQKKHLVGDPNNLSVSITTIWRTLKKLNYSRKQVCYKVYLFLYFLKIEFTVVFVN